jgi:hypothetical protein
MSPRRIWDEDGTDETNETDGDMRQKLPAAAKLSHSPICPILVPHAARGRAPPIKSRVRPLLGGCGHLD